jgi:predicted DNA-binding transcriptional regulator YafY
MRPADRLFQIVLHLGRGRVVTARYLAEQLGVSDRTVYRDIQDLVTSGVPIEGEAGVGYRLRRGFQVPPLMFDGAELQSLVFGVRVAQAHGDPEMAKAADRVLAKVDAVLPEHLRGELESKRLVVPRQPLPPGASELLGDVREAINSRTRLFLDYRDAEGQSTERIVWPLTLAYWGYTWTLGAWCELRQAFRSFRLDRIHSARTLTSRFPDQAGKRLSDYFEAVRHRLGDSPAPDQRT